jgi:hypothetical protein
LTSESKVHIAVKETTEVKAAVANSCLAVQTLCPLIATPINFIIANSRKKFFLDDSTPAWWFDKP